MISKPQILKKSEQHKVLNVERYISPDPHFGGWAKFVQTNITKHKVRRKELVEFTFEDKKQRQQLKKNGRGWLHV